MNLVEADLRLPTFDSSFVLCGVCGVFTRRSIVRRVSSISRSLRGLIMEKAYIVEHVSGIASYQLPSHMS